VLQEEVRKDDPSPIARTGAMDEILMNVLVWSVVLAPVFLMLWGVFLR
jgi:hypothetical protein